MNRHHLFVVVLLTTLVLGCTAEEEPTTPPAPAPGEESDAPKPPPLDRIKVDVQNKRIEIEGRFCLKEGILDYLAVTSGGQEYESVIALNCKGSLLHAGLLAMSAVAGPTEEVLEYLRKNPPKDGKLPERTGTPLDVTLEWKLGGESFSVPASRALFNRADRQVQNAGHWVFTGSYFAKDLDDETKEFYMADVDKAIIAVLYMGSAVINFSHDAGNPYDGENPGYEVNKHLVPPQGTPVTIVITPAKKQTED